MYTDRLNEIKKQYEAEHSKGATLGIGITKEKLEKMVKEFCTPEDAVGIRHETLFNLFDEYCNQNGYPIVNRQTLGRSFSSVLGLCRKKAVRDGRLCWVYVKKQE